jgi:hypothetical protein
MKYIKNSSHVVSIAGMFIVLLALAAQPVMAQFDDIAPVSINLYGEGIPETSSSTSPAEMGFQQAGISVSVFTLNVDYTFAQYNWNKVDTLSFGNGSDAPWENLHTLSFGGMYGGEISDKWTYLAIAGGSTAWESGADNSHLSGMLIGGGMYTLSDALKLIGGAGVLYSSAPDVGFEDFSSISDDLPEVLPIPVLGVLWNQDAPSGLSVSFFFPIEAKVQFTTANQRLTISVDALAQVADLKVQFSPMLATTLTCSFDDELIYGLADDHVVLPVGTDEAYLKRDRRVAELMLNVTLPGNFSLNVGPYYAFDQKLSVVDKNANDLHTLELDDTCGAKIEIAWRLGGGSNPLK